MRTFLVTSILGSFAILPAVAVDYEDPGLYCVSACALALKRITFEVAGRTVKPSRGPTCTDLYVDSLFECSAIYCSERQAVDGLKEQNATCITGIGRALPPLTFGRDNLTAEPLHQVLKISQTEAYKTNYTRPVVPDDEFYDLAYRTTQASNQASFFNWTFAWSLYGYWGLVLLVSISARAISQVRRSSSVDELPVSKSEEPELRTRSLYARTSTAVRRTLLPPLGFASGQSMQVSSWPLPTRAEALLVLVYILLNFAFCFPGYDIFAGNLGNDVEVQYARYIANRAGVLALANLPLIWVFAMRNNPFLWLTGWSYSTFSQFHRWCARVATLEAVVHGICYTYESYATGRFFGAWSEQFFVCGVLSVIAMSFLVGFSMYYFRKWWYDMFLIIHFILATMLLVCIFFHVKQMSDDSFFAFIWTCAATWSLDRVLRIGRTIYCSLLRSSNGITVAASATYDPKADIVRLDVGGAFHGIKPAAGYFYYIYEPKRIRGYESHPFTLCSWSRRAISGRGSSDSIDRWGEKKEVNVTVDSSTSSSASSRIPSAQQHTFLIRPQGGFTNDLKRKITAHQKSQRCQVNLLLEGPYGEYFPLERHSDVLMIIGGSGVTAAVSRAYTLARSINDCQNLRIIWAVQQRALVDNVLAHEFEGLLEHPRVAIDIYLTGSSFARTFTTDLDNVSQHSGRPDIATLIAEARLRSSTSLAVFCCGPLQMTKACRHAVAQSLAEPGRGIALYEERFGW